MNCGSTANSAKEGAFDQAKLNLALLRTRALLLERSCENLHRAEQAAPQRFGVQKDSTPTGTVQKGMIERMFGNTVE